jgi:very-short-patch-repair endonuclease
VPRLKKTITTAKRRAESDRKRYMRGYKEWVDPFPEVHGTRPEKMVYAALTTAGIPFYFLNDLSFSDPYIDFFKEYQVDFIIPSVKVIIEVQGAYWHSKPAVIESDAYKFAVYESFGYTAFAWWDYDIETNLADLLLSSGILLTAPRTGSQFGRSTELTPVKRTKIDTSQGIRTQNAKKRKLYRTFIGTSRKRLRKVKSKYESRSS